MCQKIAKPVCKFIIYQQYINGRVTLLVIVIIIASFILARQWIKFLNNRIYAKNF